MKAATDETPAERAREAAGISPEEAARRVLIGVPYLRSVERRGCKSFKLAERLSRMYRVPIETFLPCVNRGRNQRAKQAAVRGKRAAVIPS